MLDSGTTDYVRNPLGLPTQITDARGIVTNLAYDNAGRILSKTYPASTAENITYTYDDITSGNYGVGRLTKIESQNVTIEWIYDARGNILTDTRTIGGLAHTTSYTYDLADNVTAVTYPSGRMVQYGRDGTGRITWVTTQKDAGSSPATVVYDIGYMPISQLVQALYYGNGINDWNTYTTDYEVDVLGLYNGAATLNNQALTRTDGLNLTNIWDNVSSANDVALWYSATNRLQNADGPWGENIYYYDAVGNRTYAITTPSGGSLTERIFGYSGTSNLLGNVTIAGTPERIFTHDAAGNMTEDERSGTDYVYGYNNRNRLSAVTVAGSLKGAYTYNALEQLAIRVTTNMTPAGTTHFIHDLAGNVIAETAGGGATGSTGTIREYVWLPETEIAPTMHTRAQVDRPVAVIDAVNTASPVTYFVHVDHLNRPTRMTDGSKATVWNATWTPWGAPHAITGTASFNARFPGQWFQIESGLHYNWHRHYDPSTGRYTQPDPLGFVDGPSVFAYVKGTPSTLTDRDGRQAVPLPIPPQAWPVIPAIACLLNPEQCKKVLTQCFKWISGADGGDSSDDSLNRCLKAAEGSDDDWNSFCTSSQWTFPLPNPNKNRPARCHQTPPQNRKNWCYNEFGN